MQNKKGTEVPLRSMAGRKYSLFAKHAQGTIKQERLTTERLPKCAQTPCLGQDMIGGKARACHRDLSQPDMPSRLGTSNSNLRSLLC